MSRVNSQPRPNSNGSKLRALEAHGCEPLPCPLRRGLVRRRSCQPRPVDGDEPVVELHHLRSLEALLAKALDHRSIDGILAGRERCGSQRDEGDKGNPAMQHAELSSKTSPPPLAHNRDREPDYPARERGLLRTQRGNRVDLSRPPGRPADGDDRHAGHDAATPAMVKPSSGVTPYSSPRSAPVTASAPASPSAAPSPVSAQASRTTSRRMLPADAPSARRTPNSCVRWEVRYASVPYSPTPASTSEANANPDRPTS